MKMVRRTAPNWYCRLCWRHGHAFAIEEANKQHAQSVMQDAEAERFAYQGQSRHDNIVIADQAGCTGEIYFNPC